MTPIRHIVHYFVDGCGEFPSSYYGGADKYDKGKRPSGTYPFGTEATLKCGEKYMDPTPSAAKCLQGGYWESVNCKPKTNENVSESKIGPEAGKVMSGAVLFDRV